MAHAVLFKKRFAKNKFGAVRQTYKGRSYHSKLEARHAEELDWRVKAGEITEIIPQFKIEIKVRGVFICNYYIDFRIRLADKSYEYIEVKGFETDIWRMKWRLVTALHPTWKFVIVK